MATIDYKQKIKDYMNSSEVDTLYKSMLNNLFPELKESEGERIKGLIYLSIEKGMGIPSAEDRKKALAWLEKQGEQKPLAVPKFRVGDTIKNKKTKDAVKINGVDLQNQVYYYQGWDGAATIHSDFRISEQDDWELVEQNLVECGAISDKKVVDVEVSAEYKKGFECGKQRVLKYPEDFNLCKKPAWSEEDKRKIDRIYYILRQAADTHAFSTSCRLIGDKECIELQDFLKSLRPQNTWKPSDEQMEILQYLCETSSHPNEKVIPILESLYQDLKKLSYE